MNSKVALVTGSNRGIGLAVVRGLVRKEFKVFLGARQIHDGEQAIHSWGREKEHVHVLHLDVNSAQSIREAAQEVAAEADHLDVLVNNAGVLLDDETPITDLTEENFFLTLRTNTWAPLAVIQAFLPLLRKSEDARLINVSSGAGAMDGASTYAPAYSISKAALNALTLQLAGAFTGQDIQVNSVCPGWVRTDMGGSTAPRSPEEGADTIVWLASEAPSRITGKFLRDRKPIPW